MTDKEIDCDVCEHLIHNRKWNIQLLQQRITVYETEIIEIKNGKRHNNSHNRYSTPEQPT